MKNIWINVLVFMVFIFFMGCTPNPVESLKNIQDNFKNAEIKNIPGSQYRFIVKDTNNIIWYVECLNMFDNNVSGSVEIFH
jgi:hypothetical protein